MTTTDANWRESAACRGNADLWLSTDQGPAAVQWAKDRCTGCPVLAECYDWVLAEPTDPCPHHVVAGLTPHNRRTERRLVVARA